MEKILTIDGKEIKFKTTGASPLRYKMQFHRDFFGDLAKLEKAQKDHSLLDLEVFYNIAWVFAKTADPGIKPPFEWLDDFEEFPILDIMGDLQDLIEKAIGMTNQKKSKAGHPANR